MTTQTQQFIELSDILALRAQCANPDCRTVLLVPLSGSINGALDKCPKCKQGWAKQDSGVTSSPDIQRLVDSLKHVGQLRLGCSLMFEVNQPQG